MSRTGHRAATVVMLLVLAGTGGIPASGAEQAFPRPVVPGGEYRVGRLVLEDALPGAEAGRRQPLDMLLAFREGKAVYGYARAKATWPRYQHTDNKWVGMDVSRLRLTGNRLHGEVRGGPWWGLWPLTCTIDAELRGNEVDGTYQGRFTPPGASGQVTGSLQGPAKGGGPLAFELNIAGIYSRGHIKSPVLKFTLRAGRVVAAEMTSRRGAMESRFEGGTVSFDGRKFAGQVKVTIRSGPATPGTYTFTVKGDNHCNLAKGSIAVARDGVEWGEWPFSGTVRGVTTPGAADAVHSLQLDGAIRGTGPLQMNVECRTGKVSQGHVRSGWLADHSADVSALRSDRGRLRGSVAVSLGEQIGWSHPVTCVYTLDVSQEKGGLAGIYRAAFDVRQESRGRAIGSLNTQSDMDRLVGLPADSPGWPYWMGPRDNFSAGNPEVDLVDDLADARLVWASEQTITQGREAGDASDWGNLQKLHWVYGGYSSPIVAKGRVYQFYMEPSGGPCDAQLAAKTRGAAQTDADRAFADWRWSIRADDVVVCMDAATGKTLWKQVFRASGINWTVGNKHLTVNMGPCYVDGRLYVLGGAAQVYCLDAATGKVHWRVPLEPLASELKAELKQALQEKRLVHKGGGFWNFLASAGGTIFTCVNGRWIVGLDAGTGQERWRVDGEACGRWRHEGRDRILVAQRGRIHCLDPQTAKVMWTLEGAQPVPAGGYFSVHGNRMLTQIPPASGERLPRDAPMTLACFVLEPDGAKRLWTNRDVRGGVGGRIPLGFYGDHAYINSRAEGKILQIDMSTGKVTSSAAGSMEWRWLADGRLLAVADMAHEIAGNRTAIFSAPGLKTLGEWVPPHMVTTGYDLGMVFPLVDGRVFFRGSDRLYCYDLRKGPGR